MHSFTPMAAGNSTCGSVRIDPALHQAACGSRNRFCSLTVCLSWYPRSSCPKLSTEGDLALSLQQSGGMLTKRPSEHRYLSAGGSCEFAPGNNWTNKKGTQGMAESLESGRIDSEECAALMQENIHYCDWETAILQRRSKAISWNKLRLSVHLFIYWKLILTAHAYHFPESFFHGVRWIPSIGLEVLSDWTLSLVTHRLSTIDSRHVRSVNGLKHVSQ